MKGGKEKRFDLRDQIKDDICNILWVTVHVKSNLQHQDECGPWDILYVKDVLNYLPTLGEWHHFSCSTPRRAAFLGWSVAVGEYPGHSCSASHRPEHRAVRQNQDHQCNGKELEPTGKCINISLYYFIISYNKTKQNESALQGLWFLLLV